MVAQPPDHGLRLIAHPFKKGVVLRIPATREHKVLPDQYAFLVAEVEKGMVFVHVAAPAANHVASKIFRQGDGLGQAAGVPAVERVQGDPIRAAHHDGLIINAKHEMAVRIGRLVVPAHGRPPGPQRVGDPGAGRAVDGNGADANALRSLGERLAGSRQACRYAVQIGVSIAVGPPEARAGHGDTAGVRRELQRP